MAVQKPTKLPVWDANETNIAEPPSTNQSDGWQVDANGIPQKPPFQYHNYMWNLQYKWIEYLDAKKALLGGSATQTFKVADAVNGDEAVSKLQMEYEISLNVPVSTIIVSPVSTVPTGFLECNGAELSRTTYAKLYAVIGDTYGAGDGSTTFNIPDLRGEFIRGFDNGRGVDSGRGIGTAQGDAIRNITGGIGTRSDDQSLIDRADGVFSGSETEDRTNLPSGDSTRYFRYITFDASTVVPTANENRPRNIAMMYCIKY